MKWSIRNLLALHLAVAVILAIAMFAIARIRYRAAVVSSLRSNGFFVRFDDTGDPPRSCIGCAWASAWFGEDGVALVYAVKFDSSGATTDGKEAFQGIRRLTEVRQVILEDAKWLTDEDLQLLSNCRELKTLNLSETKVTPQGIRRIVELPSLLSLFLNDTAVDDDCVPLLCRMKQLRLLGIEGTRISPEGIAKIEASLPNCAIRFGE